MISQSFTKPRCHSVRKCLLELPPFDSFIIIPSKVEFLNSGAYILQSTCFTREQVDNTLTVKIKFIIYFLTLLCNKTLKNVCLLTFRQVWHLLLSQPDDPHSRNRGYTLPLTKWFLRLKPARNETKGGGVNIFSTCSLAYKKYKMFLDNIINIL